MICQRYGTVGALGLVAAVHTGEVVEEKIVKRTIIRTDSLMNRSYEINSKEDIDKYVNELKEKILKEFEKNNNLTIR